MQTQDYRSEIDGLRAFAVLSVIAFHAFPNLFEGGFVGVDIFFVISGFLITSHIFESLDRKQFSLINFFQRRIRRIFPALIVVLIATLVFGWVSLPRENATPFGKQEIVVNSNPASNKKVWVIGDSFTDRIRPFLNRTFSEVHYIGHLDDKLNEAPSLLAESQDKPDLIILVKVERSF